MKYDFISDPGHAWLKVNKKELKRLGIDQQISHYSYMNGEYAYLEEDCDAPLFINKKKLVGEIVSFNELYEDNWMERGYSHYLPDLVKA